MPKLKPEAAIELLWERANLRYKLHAGQDKIEAAYLRSTGPIFVANCSRRLGKTYWACLKALEVALKCPHPLPRIIYASATKLDLKQFTIPAFQQILLDCPDELRPTWKISESKFVFPHNGAEIHLVGLDKRPDGGRGNYCDLYVFEEAGLIAKLDYLYSSVVYPMTITRPDAKVLVISTPSVTPASPFQVFCERAKASGDYIELNVYENPMLTPEIIERAKVEAIETGGESTWLREYMCQHVIDENLAIVPEWRQEYEKEVERPPYYQHLHRYVGMDLGTKVDFTALVYGYWDVVKQQLVIEYEDEMKGPQMTTVALKDMIEKREAAIWPGMDPPYRRISDSDNPLLLQDLGILHGMHFLSTGKDELHAMINEVRLLVKAGKILIHPRCTKTIGCVRYGVFKDQNRKTFARSTTYGHYDWIAALIYLVRNLDRYTDPIPDMRVYNKETQHIRQKRRKENRANVDAVKKMLNIKN